MNKPVDKLRDMLIRHEGFRNFPYQDSLGILTIGIGRNLQARGLSDEEVIYLFETDIHNSLDEAAKNFDWFDRISIPRQDVVICMIFNMGIAGFKKFKNMIAAIEREDYHTAAQEMLSSKWAVQVGKRAVELAHIMKHGAYPK